MSRQPIRLTERGEFVADCLKVACIFVILASFWACLTMIGI